MPVPETARTAARAAAAAFGGTPSVRRHYDRAESNGIDVLSCIDRPTENVTTYSTLGLHLAPNLMDDRDIRVELAGVADSAATDFANVLAEAAFYVAKDHWLAAPGVTFPDLLGRYDLSDTLVHLLFVPPFPWPELGSVALGDNITAQWLLGIPISETERRFLQDRGFDVFEAQMATMNVEYWRLDRPSIV